MVPEGARQIGAEVSYRVGMRRPELVRFAIVRPKYEVDSDDVSGSKISTLLGVAIRSAPLVKDLLTATAHAQQVAPYLAIDATGVLLQAPERCLRGHVWLRCVADTCVLVSFTKRHDSESASIQLGGWSCPTLADGAQVFDGKRRETHNDRAGCWSHARRKLVYAAPTDGRALVGVRWINELFEIER